MSVVGDRIRELRRARRLTTAELAGRVSVSRTTVGNWEHDRSAPSSVLMNAIAEALAVSVDDLCGTGSVVRIGPALNFDSSAHRELLLAVAVVADAISVGVREYLAVDATEQSSAVA